MKEGVKLKKKFMKYAMFGIFLFSALIGITKVNAEQYTGQAIWPSEKIPNIYIKKFREDGYIKYQQASFIRRSEDNKFVYCLQPYVDIDNNLPYYNIERRDYAAVLNMTQEQWDRISLYAYYGYGYDKNGYDHSAQKWYAVTQVLVWRTAEPKSRIVFTDTLNGTENPNLFASEIAELEALVNNHYKRPEFNMNDLTLTLGQSVTFNDSNNVLHNYKVASTENVNAVINGNTITLTGTGIGEAKVNLVKNAQKYNEAPIVYYSNHSQNVFRVGYYDPIPANYNLRVVGGKIQITKVDSETNSTTPQGQASLIGAKYDVFDSSGNLVTTLTIGDDNTAITNNLPLDTYTIKEVSSSKGYYIDNSSYKVTVDSSETFKVTVKEKVIKNYISILKQYDYVNGNTTLLNAEANITFEIFYPDGKKYTEITTDKNGYATLDIPYGVWRIHQVNSNTGFEKIYDFYITVDENSELEQYYNILNNKLSAYLKVVKVDSETGKTIALANTKFKILNTDTNQYVSQYVGGKVYDNFLTDENGVFTTYLKLEAGNYKLVEIDSPKGYVISEEGLKFTIGEDSEYHYTTYGAFIVVEFENKPIKGQVEIYKNGEKFVIENGTFSYEDISLKGIKFNIYAGEDIKTSDGNHLYYNKGDLVETVITDDKGYVKSKKLPLGKYYLVEVETKDNYVLDTKEYHFELTEKDNKTAIVYDTYKAYNYLKKGTLEFTKTDLVSGEVIPNVKLEIYTEKDELIFSGITDNKGKVVIENLKVGKYYIVETDPVEGYVLNEEKVYFEIKDNGEVVKAEMTNKKITSTLKITKFDEEEKLLSGVKFGIYDLENNLIKEVVSNEEGYIEIELEYGKYYFKEISTLDNYVLNEEKHYFEVKTDGEIIAEKVVNEFIKGTLEFTKTDLVSGEVIPNVKLEIYTENDELIFSGLTDDKGKIIIEELKVGKYYIVETDPVEGYVLNEEKVYFEIKENGEVVKAEMTNKKITSTIIIHKLNDSNEELSGVVIGIYDLDNNLIGKYITDENGNIEVELDYGKYYYQEISTIENHILNTEKVYFEVNNDGEVIESTLINILEEVEVPSTNLDKNYLVYILIFSTGLLGLGLIIYDKKNKK